MATVTVYNFEIPDIREGDYVPAKGKSTEETIKSFHGRLIEGTAEIVDESLLSDTGRYYPANEK